MFSIMLCPCVHSQRETALAMKTDSRWSRRAFLQGAGCAASLGLLNKLSIAQPVQSIRPLTGFAYLGSISTSQIHVFQLQDRRWILRQSLASKSPSFLAVHPDRQFLYVANAIDEHQGLPCGTVESYKINDTDGSLTFLNRQALSLSGVRPRHLTISPDGCHLIVAIYGGGAYNVLPIRPNGEVGRPTGILKETGAGLHAEFQQSAHPHTVRFDQTGKFILGTDQGCDRLNVFALQDGKLTRSHQLLLREGAGPGDLAMHGSLLYVSNASDGSLTGYMFDSSAGKVVGEVCNVKPSLDKPGRVWSRSSLIIPSASNVLYSSNGSGTIAWRIDPTNGSLSQIQRWESSGRSPDILTATPGGFGIIAIDRDENSLMSIGIDPVSGEFREVSELAVIAGPASVAIRHA
jgi:6-phosphogluconolactonase